jgi:phage recombination protein Bet
MTEIEVHNRVVGSALVIDPEQNYWTDHQARALAQLGVKDASPGDLAVYFHQCQRTGLDPFARQIYMIGRKAKENNQWVTKQTIQTGIDGFRLIGRRAADRAHETLGYEDTQWCGTDGVWRDVWTDTEAPVAARAVVLRNGQRFPAVAHTVEYVQTYKDQGGNEHPNTMWTKMVRNQIAKCAEALALRKAFPQDLSGLYTDDEMRAQVIDADPEPPRRPRVTAAQIMEPAPDAGPTTNEPPTDVSDMPAVELITQQQLKALHALCGRKGFKDRDDRLDYIRDVVQIDIASTKDLTREDASKVLDALAGLADPA